MTIDEAIAHAREVAEKNRNFDVIPEKVMATSTFKYNCIKCAEEHEQLAEWLEELKAIKSDGFTDDLLNMGFTKGYNKAIDDFSERIKQVTYTSGTESDGYYKIHAICERDIDEIAEQLKAGDGE